MAKFTSPLDGVRVAAPCPADWDKMVGDERARYCGQCNLHVYNLSGMTRKEAEALITNTEGRLCVRFYRRADGTILTLNCPVGLRALKRRVTRIASATLSAVLGFFAGVGLYLDLDNDTPRIEDPNVVLNSTYTVTQGERVEPRQAGSDVDAEPVMGKMLPVAGQLVRVETRNVKIRGRHR